MKNLVLVSLVLLLLNSCNQIVAINKVEKEKIINDIVKMFDNYHNDIKGGGLTSEFKYLDRSEDFFWVPPGYKSALSYDSIKTILEINARYQKSVEFSWDTLQVFPLSNKIANYSGIVNGVIIDNSGTKSYITIIESGTVIKRMSGWKILNGQSAIIEPEPNN